MLSKIKMDYLRSHIGFHIDDLTAKRRSELNVIGKPQEWVYAALSKKTAQEWNRYGFGLMKEESFSNEVDEYIKLMEEKKDEEFMTVKISPIGKKREKVLSVYQLAQYPSQVWIWCDEDHVQSLRTNIVFTVIGGRETYEKFISGETNVKVPECSFFWNKRINNWDTAKVGE